MFAFIYDDLVSFESSKSGDLLNILIGLVGSFGCDEES